MKRLHQLLNSKTAQNASVFMKWMCYLVMALFALLLILCCMGRLEYDLRFAGENYPNAIYAEENHEYSSRALTVSSNDTLYIHAHADDGSIELATYATLVSMYVISIIPMMFAFYFLSKVFANVAKGEIFIQKNAHYLLYYGLIQLFVALLLPFIKLLIVVLANHFVSDVISMSTGSDIISSLMPNIGILVAAYIIHYGVSLQDEADHTL